MSTVEEKTSQYWFSAFLLYENPFRFFEMSTEEFTDYMPFLEPPMYRKVKAFLNSNVSAIVRGTRGCGKTALLYLLKNPGIIEESEETDESEDLIGIITPKDMDAFNKELFLQLNEETVVECIKRLWGVRWPLRCLEVVETKTEKKVYCKLCPTRCENIQWGRGTDPPGNFYLHIHMLEIPCKAREKIVFKVRQDIQGHKILFDVPDNVESDDLRQLASLCSDLLRNLNTVIIFATLEQAEKLRKLDVFARFPIVDFELPSKDFFMKLFRQRINMLGRHGENEDAPLPFKDEVIEKLTKYSGHVPRTFIQLCSFVLTEMWLRGMKEPCDLSFLDILDIKPTVPVSEQDKLLQVLERHKGEWVSLQQLTTEISETIGASFAEKKVSSILKKLGFTLRKLDATGKVQVLITSSTLEAHLKK